MKTHLRLVSRQQDWIQTLLDSIIQAQVKLKKQTHLQMIKPNKGWRSSQTAKQYLRKILKMRNKAKKFKCDIKRWRQAELPRYHRKWCSVIWADNKLSNLRVPGLEILVSIREKFNVLSTINKLRRRSIGSGKSSIKSCRKGVSVKVSKFWLLCLVYVAVKSY